MRYAAGEFALFMGFVAQAQFEQVKSEAAASSVQVEKLTSQLAAVKHEARDLHQQVASLTQQVRAEPWRISGFISSP